MKKSKSKPEQIPIEAVNVRVEDNIHPHFDSEEIDSHDNTTSAGKSRRKSPIELRRYAKQIWLAGLGAFSRSESAEGSDKGLFDSLVKVGEELESKTYDSAEQISGKVNDAKERALGYVNDAVDRVEKLLDHPLTLISNHQADIKGIGDHDDRINSILQRLDQIEHTQQQLLNILTQSEQSPKLSKK